MSSNGKDVVYVDVDDEITGMIDKVTNSDSKIVALVLPKRASVFQSIVNMKLLKKRADTAKKQAVLITSESGLLPMAGSVGLYVAKTLQSKPEVPAAAVSADTQPMMLSKKLRSTAAKILTRQKAAEKPVGELAGDASPVSPEQSPEETIEIDNSEPHITCRQ